MNIRLKTLAINSLALAGVTTISAMHGNGHGLVKVLVAYTGHGMTLQSQQLLFHMFRQASSSLLTRDTTRGKGLGLYIFEMIIEIIGGKINLKNP